MKKIKILILVTLLTCAYIQAQIVTPAIEQQAKEIVSKMTLEEKIDYIGGINGMDIRAIPRLGIPVIHMSDGPQGVRNNEGSTLYPCGILTASTWNRAMAQAIGEGIGRDCKARGINIILAPGVNIYRSPLCGRNFEYFGEDPYLSSETAVEYIKGVQSQGVIATIKHFAANNEEWDRHHVSSDVDERTLQEIYLPAFRKAIEKAHVGAVMNSYNLLNGVHTSENVWLNIDMLRKQWGFKGILMSDWVSTYSTVGVANGGLDLEMPTAFVMNKKDLLPAIKNGLVSQKSIDLKVQHILQTLISFNMLTPDFQDKSIALDNKESDATTLEVAREGIVLLKNEHNVLPLHGKTLVIGVNANHTAMGGGSGEVTPFHTVTVWKALSQMSKKDFRTADMPSAFTEIPATCFTAASGKTGYNLSFFDNMNLEKEAVATIATGKIDFEWKGSPVNGVPANYFSARATTCFTPEKSELVHFEISGDDGYRLYINDQLCTQDWGNHGITSREYDQNVVAGQTYKIVIEYYQYDGGTHLKFNVTDQNPSQLKKVLQSATKGIDNIVLCLGFDRDREKEDADRTFELPVKQQILIDEAKATGKNVIVVLNAGGGVKMTDWINQADGLLMAWYPGQEGGRAIADILTGNVNPSGKLPISIERELSDNPTYNSYHFTEDTRHDNLRKSYKRIQYLEGLFFGYRGYDQTGTAPLFPFGFGLSYTEFHFSHLTVNKQGEDKVLVSFDVTNTGKCDGAEVAQVYVHDIEASVPRPFKELKGYEKVFLKRNETKHIYIELGSEAFSFYDVDCKKFKVEPGDFEILVGGSSVSLPLKSTITLTKDLSLK